MRHIRRTAAIALNLLMLHLVLYAGTGAGAAECKSHGAAMTPESGAMMGHAMAGEAAPMPDAHYGASAAGDPVGHTPTESRSSGRPCDIPLLPGGCATMASCTVALVASDQASASPDAAPGTVAAEALIAPLGPVSPPEPPPPRS